MSKAKWILGFAAVVTAGAAAVWFWSSRDGLQQNVFRSTGHVRSTEFSVSSKIGGRIEEIPISESQNVEAGEVLAKVASAEVQAQLDQAKSRFAAAQKRVTELAASLRSLSRSIEKSGIQEQLSRENSTHRTHESRERLEQADAAIAEAESGNRLAQTELERYSKLLKDGIISEKDFDRVRAQAESAAARLTAARKNRSAVEAGLQREESLTLEVAVNSKETQRLLSERDRLEASYAASKDDATVAAAAIDEIQARFADTVIRAPVQATVIEKLIEKGELAAPGTRVATLMDLSDVYVRIYVPETDIGRIRLADSAEIFTDAFPGRVFTGKVRKVAQRAEFTPKDAHVEEERAKLVFGVEVAVENPDGYLKPGMSVDVTVNWKAP